MGNVLRQPKLWITLASLTFIAGALAQQAGQLRQLSLVANGWWWLVLGLALTRLSILINGLAWHLLVWLNTPRARGGAAVSQHPAPSTCRGDLASGGAGSGVAPRLAADRPRRWL